MINMDLESTIVTINNLLKLDFESSFSDFIQPQKQLMAIPDYQREYKWEKSKIKTFVDNVMQRSKFLGIITVEAPISNFLSLVDGQQRLTTIILMLAQLYNACADEDETETQDEIGPNNCWANFIWIDKDFNRDSLKNKDIINKIIILRGTYVASEAPHNGTYAKKHSHIEIICQHIMKTNGYGELLTAYNNNAPRADVLRRYQTFINNYFSEDSLKELQDTLTNEFVQKLQELYQMI